MSADNRRELKAKWVTGGTAIQGMVVAPGSGATITLWDSGGASVGASQGTRYKRVIVNVFASAASAASGLSFQESHDDGTNWDELVAFSILATTYTKNTVAMSAPRLRVRYTNSASVLTTWRGGVIVDEYDNAGGA
jgi:hypothetical protein